MNIAALVTCHNRREKTVKSVANLFESLQAYNARCSEGEHIDMRLFLTDDGCADGTAQAVSDIVPAGQLTIVQGDGNLFWAGGMRMAWREALGYDAKWDYFLLFNDDTYPHANLWDEMMACSRFCRERYGREGIYSGICCGSDGKVTYGGVLLLNKIKGVWGLLEPSGTPACCDFAHANMLMVHHTVVDAIGILNERFRHEAADYDYSGNARKVGFPVLVTAHICGVCEYDHPDNAGLCAKLASMSMSQRRDYFKRPSTSGLDYLTFVRRHQPIRYPLAWLARKLLIYAPSIYFRLLGSRQ